jgi:type II secretion system protein G
MKRGFTLIELLVVIAIIGMLSSVVLASMNSARTKARDARRLADIKQFQTALEFYYNDNGSYPISGWADAKNSSYVSRWTALETTMSNQIPALPLDPKGVSTTSVTSGYSYSYYSGGHNGSEPAGQWYMIVFRLENTPHKMESLDGVEACDGRRFHYGSGSNGIITVGGNCIK